MRLLFSPHTIRASHEPAHAIPLAPLLLFSHCARIRCASWAIERSVTTRSSRSCIKMGSNAVERRRCRSARATEVDLNAILARLGLAPEQIRF